MKRYIWCNVEAAHVDVGLTSILCHRHDLSVFISCPALLLRLQARAGSYQEL